MGLSGQGGAGAKKADRDDYAAMPEARQDTAAGGSIDCCLLFKACGLGHIVPKHNAGPRKTLIVK
ncbi:hypothetical protein GCM10027081_06240 [Cupriavidus yeoncheonensis]